jgi:hypothetical protein
MFSIHLHNSKNSSANFRIAASLVLLAILIGVAFIGYLPSLGHFVAADSSLVQSNTGNTGCTISSTCILTVAFSSPVTSGDVIVVGIAENGLGSPLPSDTLSTTFTQMVNESEIGTTLLYSGTISGSGSDSITITDTSGSTNSIDAEIFEVSGVTTAGAQEATGSGGCSSGTCDLSTSSVAFIPGAFLISAYALDISISSFSAGSGFTPVTLSTNYYSEYSTSGVSSPTNFPASVDSYDSGPYKVIALALEPQVTATVTSPTTTTSTTTSTTTQSITTTTIQTSVSTSTSTVTQTSTVFVYPTNTQIHCVPSRVQVGRSVDCTAIVSSKSTLPNGSISFGWSEGKIGALSPPVNCVPVGGSTTKCSATIAFNFPKMGDATVSAAYSGDMSHQKSHAATMVHVVK